jgi:hypothetical protein
MNPPFPHEAADDPSTGHDIPATCPGNSNRQVTDGKGSGAPELCRWRLRLLLDLQNRDVSAAIPAQKPRLD